MLLNAHRRSPDRHFRPTWSMGVGEAPPGSFPSITIADSRHEPTVHRHRWLSGIYVKGWSPDGPTPGVRSVDRVHRAMRSADSDGNVCRSNLSDNGAIHQTADQPPRMVECCRRYFRPLDVKNVLPILTVSLVMLTSEAPSTVSTSLSCEKAACS